MAGLNFHYRWTWALKSSPESLWPYVSDTDRFRGATGFPSAQFTEEIGPDGLVRRVGRIRMYGFPIVWEERPMQWVRHRELTDVQDYRIGPLRQVKVHIQLNPRSDGGTDLTYEVWAAAGNLLGYPGIPVQIGLLSRMRFGRAFQQIDEFVQKSAAEPFLAKHSPFKPAGQARMQEIAEKLVATGYGPALVNHLLELIRSAPDHALSRMRPYEYAAEWNTDRQQTLEMFLQATKLGLLDLSWDLLCPQCRGAKATAHKLFDVSHRAICPSCNIAYEVDFARTVEATFQVNPAIKAIVRAEYCLGSPQNTPHIMLQQTLEPGETRTVKLNLESARYRWRIPRLGEKDTSPRTPALPEDPALGRTLIHVQSFNKILSSTLIITDDLARVENADIASGEITLTIKNQSSDLQLVVLEQTNWSENASTAAEVTTLQAFRDLFSSEVLRPGESIGVERLAIMFTDLKGSTVMYQVVGDAPAFRRVMDHFNILRDGVASHHGALVKTIGDAIMAVFTDPANALEAAFEILENMYRYNADSEIGLTLKMGIHQGTCIAVTLNERLDYFGSVVNLAARLEGQSQGHDVVVSNAVFTDPAVADVLARHHIQVESFTTSLKGFAESFSLHRLIPPTQTAPSAAESDRTLA